MIKNFILSLAMILVLNPVFGQRDYKQLYEHKIHSFTRMTHAGWAMTGIGGGLAVTGAVLLFSVPGSVWDGNYNQDQSENINNAIQAMAGLITLCVGVGLAAGGITMASIGSHKVKSYQNKLDHLSIGLICTPNKQGIMLTYRF